jgi:CHAT domain-containing protein
LQSIPQKTGNSFVHQVKGRTLDASAESISLLRRNLDDKGRALLGELTQVTAQRSKFSLDGPGTTPIEVFRKRLDELDSEQERLESELSSRSSLFQKVIQPVTLERVQQVIPASDVLIEWIRFTPINPKGRNQAERRSATRYAAYLIARDKTPVVVDLGEATTIARAVAQLQDVLRRPDGNIHPEEARTLFNLVMQPLLTPLAQLQPNPARLLLSPDGALNLIPFAALVDDHGYYLGQRFEMSYLTSGRDLLRMDIQTEKGRDSVTVVAAPNYGLSAANGTVSQGGGLQTVRSIDFDRSYMRFGPLPGTAGEARLLKQLFKLDDAHVITGNAASEARIKKLQGPRMLHIATHGFFLHDQLVPRQNTLSTRGLVESAGIEGVPQAVGENALLRSGLALAGANTRASAEGEDGILTAAEAAQLDLQGTQLVVLSACETGSGDVLNGEGVYGLRRALVLAGAQSQLVSLWKVHDEATEKLMGEYYQRLAKGEGRAQALRSAQQVMQNHPATAHPFYWAAFVPIGDWRATQER